MTDDRTPQDFGQTTTAIPPGFDLDSWGLDTVAYVKEERDDEGRTAWVIHGATGAPIGAAVSRELAMAATVQSDLEPLSVH